MRSHTERVNALSFVRERWNMAITEISVADSITRGYYYRSSVGVPCICRVFTRMRLHAFDVFAEIKGKSAMFRDDSNDQVGFYDVDALSLKNRLRGR